MPRIPRAERSVSYQPAMMPASQGGGYAAPGQAMQSVGRGIADLGNAFAGLGEAMDKENQFNDDVAKLKASHALDMDLIKYRETFNGDPDQYEAGAQSIIDNHMNTLRGSLRSHRSQQRFPLFQEQIAGPRREQLAREGMGRRHDKMFSEADSAIAGEFSKLTQYPKGLTDDDYEIALGQVRWTAEQIIDKMPLNESRKEALRNALTQQTLKAIQSMPGGPARFVEKWLQLNPQGAGPAPAEGQGQPVPVPASGAGPDYRGQRGPAAIRYNNPGAMWPGPSSRKFGAVDTVTLNDGQGNKIAVFPDAVSGAAAQFDLLERKYTGKTLASAIRTWSGGNSSDAYAAKVAAETGLTPGTILTKDMIRDPRIAIPIARSMASMEAGRKEYPLAPEQWAQGHQMAFGGGKVASAAAPVRVASLPQQTATDATAAPRAENKLPGSAPAQEQSKPLNGEVLPPERGPQMAQAAPARRIDGMLTEALLKARPTLIAQQAEMANKMLGEIEKLAVENGYQADPRIMEQTRRVVEATGSPELQQRFALLGAKVQLGQQVNQATERELLDRIQAMRVQMASGTVTPEQVAHVGFLENKLKAVTAGLEKDPYQFAAKNGLLPAPLPGLTPAMMGKLSPDQFGELLQQRATARAAIQMHYQRQVPLFQADEAQALTAFLKQGGEARLGFLEVMYEALGPGMIDAMREISKDAPDLATVGWLVASRGEPFAVRDAMATLEDRQKHGYKAPPMKEADIERETQRIVGDGAGFAFQGNTAALRHAMEAAKLIYERRVAQTGKMATTDLDTQVWEKALREAMGQNTSRDGRTVYGGIATVGATLGYFGGQKTYVPPWLKRDGGLEEIMSKVRLSELAPGVSYATGAAAAAGRPEPKEGGEIIEVAPDGTRVRGGPPSAIPGFGPTPNANSVERIAEGGVTGLGMPITASGKPVPMSVIRNAVPVWITGSQYLLQTGRTATGEPIYLKRAEFDPLAGGKGHWEVVPSGEGTAKPFPNEKIAREYAAKNGGEVRPLITPGAIVAGQNFVLDLDVIRRRIAPRVEPGTFRDAGN